MKKISTQELQDLPQIIRKLYRSDHGLSYLERKTISGILRAGVEGGAFAPDRHEIDGLSRHLLTALAAIEEIGLKQSAVITILIFRPTLKGIYSLSRAREDFGEDTALLLENILKVSDLYARNAKITSENFSHFLLSFAEDIRVILILIADRLMQLRLARYFEKEEEQVALAMEVSFLYAPLAHRLGLYTIKSEMEDLCLKYTDRETFDFVKQKISETKASRDAYIDSFIAPLKERLTEAGLSFEIKGRTKSISSIRNKLKKQGIEFESIYDLFAIRIVLDVEEEKERGQCWQVYSIVTDMYRPNPKRLKDWISIPKSNGYESLHITVMGPENKWVEVQIRSQRMDEIAEKGLAAHWRYKGIKSESGLDEFLTSVRQVLESRSSDDGEMIKDFKMDLYDEEIYVFTPKGDLIKLPQGATVLDFAFAIHTNIGSRCVSGNVNGKNVSIRHVLHNGEAVSITTSNSQQPKPDWIQYVVTSKARVKIKQFLREQAAKSIDYAKEELRRKLKNRKLEYDDATFIKLVKKRGYKHLTDFYLSIVEEHEEISTFLDEYKRLLEEKNKSNESEVEGRKAELFVTTTEAQEKSRSEDVLLIDKNLSGIEYKLAKCCNPIYGDRIFAFTSNSGLRIHRMDCPNAPDLFKRFGYRILQAKWSGKGASGYEVALRIVGHDDISIVSSITSLITKEGGVSLKSYSIESNDGLFIGFFHVIVKGTSDLSILIKKLKGSKGVKQVDRLA